MIQHKKRVKIDRPDSRMAASPRPSRKARHMESASLHMHHVDRGNQIAAQATGHANASPVISSDLSGEKGANEMAKRTWGDRVENIMVTFLTSPQTRWIILALGATILAATGQTLEVVRALAPTAIG